MQKACTLCPRNCRVDRENTLGTCQAPSELVVSKYMLHMWEEPIISGENGSGAIFFSGCSLRCVYCQNKEISQKIKGEKITPLRLSEIFLELQERGAHNINLVTPTHYSDKIREALDLSRGKLKIPVIYNTSGYEKVEEIEKLADYVDVFLVDLKYYDSEISKKYSLAPDYFERALPSFKKMLELKKEFRLDKNGLVLCGVILRHLTLPSHRHDSIALLTRIAKETDISTFKLSLMSQYTPDFCSDDFSELKRRITSFEYDSVVEVARKLGYDGFIQEKSSAKKKYTPDF